MSGLGSPRSVEGDSGGDHPPALLDVIARHAASARVTGESLQQLHEVDENTARLLGASDIDRALSALRVVGEGRRREADLTRELVRAAVQAGCSQRAVGRALGVTTKTVGRWLK